LPFLYFVSILPDAGNELNFKRAVVFGMIGQFFKPLLSGGAGGDLAKSVYICRNQLNYRPTARENAAVLFLSNCGIAETPGFVISMLYMVCVLFWSFVGGTVYLVYRQNVNNK